MICVILFAIGAVLVHVLEASHGVKDQYSGTGLIPAENEGALKDQEDTPVQCILSGSTYVEIVWKWRNARTLKTDYYFTWDTTHLNVGDTSFSTGTLSFTKDLSEADRRDASGVIYAEGAHADDPNVKTVCRDVSLTFIWKPAGTPVLSLNKSPLEIGKDHTAQLTCLLTDKGNPEGQVRWIRNGNLQSEPEYNTQNISIPVTKDINDDKWQCYYNNAAGDGDYSNEVTIKVNWKPDGAPALSVGKNPLDIEQDSTVQLTCQLTDKGNPVGQVRWRRNGNLQDESVYNTPTITISVTKDTDGDTWQCYYYNTVGDGDNSYAVVINVHWKAEGTPSMSVNKSPLVIGEDSTAQLTCKLTDKGNPESQVKWIKDGMLQTGSEYNTQTITIPLTRDINGDKWQCYYYNAAGDGDYSNEAIVNVHWKPQKPVLSVNKDPLVIDKDSTVQLTCQLTDKGNPEGQVKWIKDGIIQTGSQYNTQTISIPVTRDINGGKWQCYYYNAVEDGDYSDEEMPNVHWNVSSDNVILNGPQGNVTVGDAVTLSLSLNDPGNPPAMPSWYHNGTKKDGKMFSDFVVTFENIELSDSGTWACSASNGFSGTDKFTYTLRVMPKPPQDGLPIWVYIIIAVVAAIIVIVIIVIIVVVTKKKNTKKSDTVVGEHANDQYAYNNKSFDAKTGTGHYDASKTNAGAEDPVYSAVSKGKPLAPIADGAVYSQVDLSKKTSRKSMKGLPMSKKAIDRIIFHKKDGYVNMTFQVRKKFDGDIEISVCRVGDQSCTSKVSKQHDGASKDVVMVLPIEDSSPDNYSIHIKFIERGQVTQTVDLTYPYNKNAVNVTVLNNVYGTNVSPSHADVEVEGVPSRPPRQGYPAEGVTYAVMDWDRSQAPGRPPRLSARSQAQEHVVYADVRPGGNVY